MHGYHHARLCRCAQALAGVAYEVRGRAVDAVLYLHRLDDFRVDASDVQVRGSFPCFTGRRRTGRHSWPRALLSVRCRRLAREQRVWLGGRAAQCDSCCASIAALG